MRSQLRSKKSRQTIPTSPFTPNRPKRQGILGSLVMPLSLATLLLITSGCGAAQWVGLRLLFDETPLPEQQILRDISYVDEDAHPVKHRFDLFLPKGENWPTLVFVHGGSWVEGDKNLHAKGIEIYANIGTFYASQGIGAAVINYRLQPEVTWHDQVKDVARAVARIRREVAAKGGDPDAMFLSGHSAGGQLAAFTAVADWPEIEVGSELSICGIVAVSGAGYDLSDAKTYELGADPEYYEARFATPKEPAAPVPEDWQTQASVVSHLDPTDPPFLVFYGGSEYPTLQHQAKLLHGRLQEAGVDSQLAVVPKQGHRRIVLTLSQGKNEMTSQVLRFIETQHRRCRSAT